MNRFVKLINIKGDDSIAAVAKVVKDEDEEDDQELGTDIENNQTDQISDQEE